MAMLVKELHAKKAELEMLVNDPGIVTFFKELHSPKAHSPMDVTDSGIVTLSKHRQKTQTENTERKHRQKTQTENGNTQRETQTEVLHNTTKYYTILFSAPRRSRESSPGPPASKANALSARQIFWDDRIFKRL